MVELRIVIVSSYITKLQYRFITPNVDASGALCPPGEWSEWKDVPTISAQEAGLSPAALSALHKDTSDAK